MKMLFKINAYNYNLLEARKEIGLTQIEAAHAIGIPIETLAALEKMKTSLGKPLVILLELFEKVAGFYGEDVEYLFPQEYLDAIIRDDTHWTTSWKVAKEMNLSIMSGATTSQLLLEDATNPEDGAVITQMQQDVRDALKYLPPREAMIISLRYGLEDGLEHTQEEVARSFGVSKSRVAAIESLAKSRLRDPKIRRKMRSYLDA